MIWLKIKDIKFIKNNHPRITADIEEKYKLEVIALSDGFKEYTEVEVTFKPSTLESITPNPASQTAIINYKLNGVSSAYLMVNGYYGSDTSYNYILNTENTEQTINVENYPQGYYTVALISDGVITDAKTLIKQ